MRAYWGWGLIEHATQDLDILLHPSAFIPLLLKKSWTENKCGLDAYQAINLEIQHSISKLFDQSQVTNLEGAEFPGDKDT